MALNMQNHVNSLEFSTVISKLKIFDNFRWDFASLYTDDARMSRVSDRIHRTHDYIQGISNDDSLLPERNFSDS